MNVQKICSCPVTMLVPALLWLAHRVWGLGWEAVIDFFHNYLYTCQSIEISKKYRFLSAPTSQTKTPPGTSLFPKMIGKTRDISLRVLRLLHCAFQLLLSLKISYHVFTKESASPLA